MKVHDTGSFFEARVSLIHAMRKAGRDRPLGTWGRGPTWTPDQQEHQSCCDAIMGQGQLDALRLFNHCKSRKHIANLVASRYAQNYYPSYEGEKGENTIYSYSPTGDVTLSIHP